MEEIWQLIILGLLAVSLFPLMNLLLPVNMFNQIINFFLQFKKELVLKIFGIEFIVSRNNHLWIKGINGLILDYQMGLLSCDHQCENLDEMELFLRSKVDIYSEYEATLFSSPKVQVLLWGKEYHEPFSPPELIFRLDNSLLSFPTQSYNKNKYGNIPVLNLHRS